MNDYKAYRRLITLKNGLRVMFRLLKEQDKEGLVQMFQETPEEDARFLKQDVKDVGLVNSWVDHIDYHKVLPLLALEFDSKLLIGDATLHRGKHSDKHIGEVRIFIARPFRNLGLGSIMLDELISLAQLEGLQWLKAEIIAEHTKVIKAFREKGFEAKATLDDYFIRQDGLTHDVVLMVRPVVKREEAEF
jgi:L-amino acid N-acyltransferase YncA